MTPAKPWYKRPVTWVIAGLVLLMCCIGGALGNSKNETTTPPPAPVVSATNESGAPASAAAQVNVAKPAQGPVTLTGSGAQVKATGATLNGAFRVDYSGDSSFLIVEFLNASGDSGAGFMEEINEYGDSAVSGSTIVHLTNVTQIKTSNTRAKWSVTLTPIG